MDPRDKAIQGGSFYSIGATEGKAGGNWRFSPAGKVSLSAEARLLETLDYVQEANIDYFDPEKDPRKLAASLVEAVCHDKDRISALIDAGASPFIKPYRDGAMILYRDRIPESAFDWAIFLGNQELVVKFLEDAPELSSMQATKALEMAAFSQSMPILEHIYEKFSGQVDMAHAFAYAINQAFTDGAVFLFEHGALEDARRWVELALQFNNFKMFYILMSERPAFDTGDDFYSFIFDMPGIDSVLSSRGKTPANSYMRQETIAALADAGMFTEEVYREYALRALVFDECPLLAFLDDKTGFSFTEVFSSENQDFIELWIRPGMSKRKIEIIASMMPDDFRFPITPRYLIDPTSVKALVPYSSKQTCEYPEHLAEYLVLNNCAAELSLVADWGGITKDNIDYLLDIAQKHFYTQVIAFLIEYREKHFADNPFEALDIDAL